MSCGERANGPAGSICRLLGTPRGSPIPSDRRRERDRGRARRGGREADLLRPARKPIPRADRLRRRLAGARAGTASGTTPAARPRQIDAIADAELYAGSGTRIRCAHPSAPRGRSCGLSSPRPSRSTAGGSSLPRAFLASAASVDRTPSAAWARAAAPGPEAGSFDVATAWSFDASQVASGATDSGGARKLQTRVGQTLRRTSGLDNQRSDPRPGHGPVGHTANSGSAWIVCQPPPVSAVASIG